MKEIKSIPPAHSAKAPPLGPRRAEPGESSEAAEEVGGGQKIKGQFANVKTRLDYLGRAAGGQGGPAGSEEASRAAGPRREGRRAPNKNGLAGSKAKQTKKEIKSAFFRAFLLSGLLAGTDGLGPAPARQAVAERPMASPGSAGDCGNIPLPGEDGEAGKPVFRTPPGV